MASVEGDLEEQLLKAGKVLFHSPSSPNQLLTHLDQVGKLLGKVDQSPSKSMLTALSPTIKALIEEDLLRNENEDVRVAVASCISEITRITAPEAPYGDNQMKEVFQLIVSSFENLSDNSSQSYSKRTSILDTVAKVRSCVVMLDLECDGLIAEMFQHFLKAIRDHHPENVFSSMEVIMTLVLEESEDIGFELISPILASLKKNNQEVQPIARKLAENVIRKCEAKVKPCLLEAKSSMNFSFDDYSTIISEIGKEINHVGHVNDKSPGEQLMLDSVADGASSGADQDQVVKEIEAETLDEKDQAPAESTPGGALSALVETGPEVDHPVPVETSPGYTNPAPVETSPREEHPVPVDNGSEDDHPDPVPSSKSATSNGVAETEIEDVSASPCSSEKPKHTNEEDQSHDDATMAGKGERGDLDDGTIVKLESKTAQVSKKRSKKPKHSKKSTEPSGSSYTDTDTDKEPNSSADEDIILDKEVHASLSGDPSTEVAEPKEKDGETEHLSSPIALDNELENVSSPSPSGNAPDDGPDEKGRSKKKNKSSKQTSRSKDVAAKAATDGTDNLEVKLQERTGKKARVSDSPAEKSQVPVKKSKVEVGSKSDSEIKVVKKSSRKDDPRDHTGGGSSSKKKVDDKGRAHGKTTLEKEAVLSKEVKDDSPLKESFKTSSKRKRTPTIEKVTDAKKNDEDLVGVRIKVWWPMDKMFYEGVVDSFDPKNKKHMVSYADGDLERLNLREEKWELVEDDKSKDGDQETRAGSPDTSPEIQKKKKVKTGSETSAKKGKTENLRDVEVSPSKYKGTAKKPSRKEDVKPAEVTPKSSAKSDDIGGKSKARSKKSGGKSSADASEKAGKSKDSDNDTPKPSVKFKLGSPKTVTKGTPNTAVKESIKSGGKSSPSSAKVKSGSAKSKETKKKEKSPEVVKAGKRRKEKPAETSSKGKESEGKSGKKRRRS